MHVQQDTPRVICSLRPQKGALPGTVLHLLTLERYCPVLGRPRLWSAIRRRADDAWKATLSCVNPSTTLSHALASGGPRSPSPFTLMDSFRDVLHRGIELWCSVLGARAFLDERVDHESAHGRVVDDEMHQVESAVFLVS